VAATRMISIVGKKDAGKTSLVVALAAELARQGKLRVMTIKHGTHAAESISAARTPGDTTTRQGGACRDGSARPAGDLGAARAESDPISLARRYLDGADLVLVEGFAVQPLPKIETYRLACGRTAVRPARPDAELWVAMITDNPRTAPPFPSSASAIRRGS